MDNKDLEQAKKYFTGGLYDEILQLDYSKRTTDLVTAISNFVQGEGKGMTTSQLRNIFSKVKREKDKDSAQLLRPLLAYTAARQATREAKVIIALLDDRIKHITTDEQLGSFKSFMEAVVAYHKFHHPRKS
jgi:CRISPR type III-A-associated protein Csm2